jgi:hypothetical protein
LRHEAEILSFTVIWPRDNRRGARPGSVSMYHRAGGCALTNQEKTDWRDSQYHRNTEKTDISDICAYFEGYPGLDPQGAWFQPFHSNRPLARYL